MANQKVTSEMREKMRLLRGHAVPIEDIAEIMNVDPQTVTNNTNEPARLRHNKRTREYAKMQRSKKRMKRGLEVIRNIEK